MGNVLTVMPFKAKTCPPADNWCDSGIKTIKTSFIWTISDFSKSPEKTGEKLESLTFSAEEDITTKWCLGLYPKGLKEETKEFVGIYLYLKCLSKRLFMKLGLKASDSNEVSVKYKLAIIDGNQHIYKELGIHSILSISIYSLNIGFTFRNSV